MARSRRERLAARRRRREAVREARGGLEPVERPSRPSGWNVTEDVKEVPTKRQVRRKVLEAKIREKGGLAPLSAARKLMDAADARR